MELTTAKAIRSRKPEIRQEGPTVSAAALRVGLAHLIHEINNPLHHISTAATFLETHRAARSDSGDPFIGETFRGLQNEIARMSALLKSLQTELKCLWTTEPSLEAVDLNLLTREVLQGQSARFEAMGIETVRELAPALPAILGNRHLLKVALLNLVRNAADAMPAGGTLSTRSGLRDGSVYLEISDTGGGIPADVEIFEPFTSSKPGGTGLGLAITRYVVELHGGRVGHESRPGRGALFTLRFPPETIVAAGSGEPSPVESPEQLYGCLCHASSS